MNVASGVETAIGIDLGTTLSVIAYVDADGRPTTILNSEGDLTTPSAVLFEDSAIVVGKEAMKAAAFEPQRVADFPKRDMGSTNYCRRINGELIPPEVIQSLILEKLKADAELKLGPIRQAVITVPAFFNEPRRKATQDAGKLAGWDVLDLINEPTAAALAYGTQNGFLNQGGESHQRERILVYDLGGGTFDVTVMEIDGSSYRTLATAGDVLLGGLDWDRRIVNLVAEDYQRNGGPSDPRNDPAGLKRLLREAEDAKRALSVREKVTVSFEYAGCGTRVLLTRPHFEQITADLLQRTLFTARSTLRDAGLQWGDLTRLLLVGGSTRMPAVHAALESESGLKVDRQLSADEAVAHGAAIYAGMLASVRGGQKPRMTIENVNSHNLGVLGRDPATGRPRNGVIIPRNSPLPLTKGKRFRTARANQRSIVVKVLEGGDASGRNATLIGTCAIRDLEPGLPEGTSVDVYFRYETNGRLTVYARLPDLDREAVLTIERETGLTEANLAAWDQRLHRVDGPLRLE